MSSKGTATGLLSGLLLAAFAAAAPIRAQQAPATSNKPALDVTAQKCATTVCLAYVATTSAQVNNDAQSGLEALQDMMTKKTTVHPGAVVALNIEQADLSVYNFIYWPVTAGTQPLSDNARQKVQNYINRGGVLLFDTMGETNTALRGILGNINVRPLANLDKNHTLAHAFYRLENMPGSNDYNVWVESGGAQGAENVTSVIIGNNNWAGAWAGRTLPSNSQARALAMRAGVNMALYALAGNFKSDPVQQTLEKLGRSP